MSITARPFPKRDPYEGLAEVYPLISDAAAHRAWVIQIESIAARHGLRGRRLLDLACGTGQSFMPLLETGYEVTACDVSPAMLRVAQRAARGRARIHRADVRALPELGTFDLITCLDDALNHLTTERELRGALSRIRSNLAPAGLVVFDVNTLATLRSAFSSSWTRSQGTTSVSWTGLGDSQLRAGQATSALIRVACDGAGGEPVLLTERHHPLRDLPGILLAAGLEQVALYGQQRGGAPQHTGACEDDHKVLVIARHDTSLQAWARAHGHERGL